MNNDNYSGMEPSKTAPVATTESMDSLNHEKNDEAGKVTFSKGDNMKNGESVVEINTPPEVVFSGMGKEELSKYANDPFWVRVRWFLFIVFWVTWVGMLAAAIIIVVLAPKCTPPPNLNDLQKGSIYKVLTHSFKDGQTEQDGVGDFKGIIDRVSHFTSLETKMVLLAPIFESPSLPRPDYQYSITNFIGIDSKLGSQSDFDELIETAKKNDIKVFLDMIPNHSSDEHPWFKQSVVKAENYSDYYVWKKSDNENPPDETKNYYGDSAWTLEPTRNEWYLHMYHLTQPDLNYDNPQVLEELMSTLRFWLDRGVSGFRLNSVEYIFENDDGLHKTLGLLDKIRQLLKSYEARDELERTLLTDMHGVDFVSATVDYYGNQTSELSAVPFNFDFIQSIEHGFDGSNLSTTISECLSSLPSWGWPVWVSGSEYTSRLANRFDTKLIDGIAMIQILLPGTPSMYYGEEIGMHNVGEILDDYTAYRSPMQWNARENAGFSSKEPWSPVADDFNQTNVEKETLSERSHLKVYEKLLKIRREGQDTFMHGDTGFPIVNEDIFSFIRVRKGSPGYLVVVNGGNSTQTLDFNSVVPLISTSSEGDKITISEAKVKILSAGSNSTYTEEQPVDTDKLKVGPSEGLVLEIVPTYTKI